MVIWSPRSTFSLAQLASVALLRANMDSVYWAVLRFFSFIDFFFPTTTVQESLNSFLFNFLA